MIACPGCGVVVAEGAYPSARYDPADDVAWWCRGCLAARIAAAHADDCRCVGCQRIGELI